MASRGYTVTGTTGADYLHREQVAAHYQISALNKSRLRWCVLWHGVLLLVMLCKLSADILDRLDLFILEIEQLQIPPPLWWEYAWCISALASVLALSAVKRNSSIRLRRYVISQIVFGVLPILYCLTFYAGDIYSYLSGDDEDVFMWQEYCYGLLWYWWCAVALQLHVFQLVFAARLLAAWGARTKRE